ncbi:MAG: hypothetical protein FWF72_01950, partial [Paludibacter sp.]|nr:hypothetical protein [Paludibacter sp.]
KIKYKYDENGKIIECIKKTAKLRDLRTIYFYNSIRQLIEQTEYSGQTCRSKINWEYNESGKIKKRIEIFYDSENDDLTAEYENTFFITRMDF